MVVSRKDALNYVCSICFTKKNSLEGNSVFLSFLLFYFCDFEYISYLPKTAILKLPFIYCPMFSFRGAVSWRHLFYLVRALEAKGRGENVLTSHPLEMRARFTCSSL